MSGRAMVESLESRRLFAAGVVDAAAFYDACVAADTDNSGTLSAAEATAYAGVVRTQIKTDTDAHRAALSEATRGSAGTLRDLAAERKTDLAAAEDAAARRTINTDFAAAVRAEKSRLREQLAGLRSTFAGTLATSTATRNAFVTLGRSLGKPFVNDLNADRQLDLREGDQEFGALLARDNNGASLSTRDLARLNRV